MSGALLGRFKGQSDLVSKESLTHMFDNLMLAVSWDLSWAVGWNRGLSIWLLALPPSMVAGFQEQAFLREAGCDLASKLDTFTVVINLTGFQGRDH